jgi:hypothetical protein
VELGIVRPIIEVAMHYLFCSAVGMQDMKDDGEFQDILEVL